jgi:hypothetical protein
MEDSSTRLVRLSSELLFKEKVDSQLPTPALLEVVVLEVIEAVWLSLTTV